MAKLSLEDLKTLFSGVKTGVSGVYKLLGVAEVADDVLKSLMDSSVSQKDNKTGADLKTRQFMFGEVKVVYDPAPFKSTDTLVITLEQAEKGAFYKQYGSIVNAGQFRAKLVVSSGQPALTRDKVTAAVTFMEQCSKVTPEGDGYISSDAQGVPMWVKL